MVLQFSFLLPLFINLENHTNPTSQKIVNFELDPQDELLLMIIFVSYSQDYYLKKNFFSD